MSPPPVRHVSYEKPHLTTQPFPPSPLPPQNPDSPTEMARILKAGGFVSPPPEPGLSARVCKAPWHLPCGILSVRVLSLRAAYHLSLFSWPWKRS